MKKPLVGFLVSEDSKIGASPSYSTSWTLRSCFMSSESSNADGKHPLWCLIGACSPSNMSYYSPSSSLVSLREISTIFDFEKGCSLSDSLFSKSRSGLSELSELSSNVINSYPWSSNGARPKEVAELNLLRCVCLKTKSPVSFDSLANSSS